MTSRRPRWFEVGYAGLVAVLALAGGLSQNGWYYAVAVLLTLPAGLLALVCVYPGYALVQAVGGLFVASTTADGGQPGWLAAASAALIVLLLTAGAIADLALLRIVRGRRRLRQAS